MSSAAPRPPVLPPPLEPRKKPRRERSIVLGLIGFSFASAVVLFLAVSAVAAYLLWNASRDLPDYDSLAKYEPPVMTRIHAHDGSLIAEYARERRIFVPINTVPKLVIAAYLSAEDKRFYEHGGLDFQGIARAAIKFVETKVKGGGGLQGASTITQQVAKNFLLTSDRTFDRKLKEAILAIRIERAYSKDKILELYLNEIYLGLGSYGVAAAALTYFGKELEELNLEQAAYLAALPKAPNNYHPFRRTKEAVIRRNWIIDQMVQNGYVTSEQGREAKAKPLEVNIRPFGTQIYAADYFAEEVRRQLVAQYGEDGLYGRSERSASGDGRVNGGLSVRTTLDHRMQAMAKRALIEGLVGFDRRKGWRGPIKQIDIAGDWGKALSAIEVASDIAPWRLGVAIEVNRVKAVIGLRPQRRQDGQIVGEREAVEIGFEEMKWAKAAGKPAPKSPQDVLTPGDVIYVAPKDPDKPEGVWSLMQIPEVGGGLIAMDPHTGRVVAVVGGFSFAASQFDRAMQARRQPGSSFKPLVYAAAMDNGYKPTSIVLDAPIEIDQGPRQETWRPRNYGGDNKSFGPSTLRLGIERSRNQMTVRLAQDMGMPLIAEYARRFGVYDDLLPVLSMSLGAGETTLMRMTTAYCMLANGGKQVRATLIDRIQDRWGKTIWRHDDRGCQGCKAERWTEQDEPEVEDTRKQIVDPHTAYQITSIMEGVVQRGTATVLKSVGKPLAGKTGTTNDEKDAWFVGYSPDLVVGVFIGYDTPRPMGRGQTGGQLAAPIFGSFMKMALADKPSIPFRVPPGIKLVRVSLKTGVRAQGGETDAIMEAFKPGEEPDDAYSVIGFTDTEGGFIDQSQGPVAPRSIGSGRRVY
jgi:penicillin-binding protein 1A